VDQVAASPVCSIKLSRLHFIRIVAHTYDAASALIDKRIQTDNYAKALEFFQSFEFTEIKYALTGCAHELSSLVPVCSTNLHDTL
jgi:hypothetical protein